MSLTKVKGVVWDAFENLGAVNVLEFGATGDGTTNDTAAVQAAIDFAVANGGNVLFPAGNYRIEDQLLIDESSVTDETDITRVSLKGDGMGNTKLRFVGTSQATSGIKYLGASLEAYIEIASLRLEGVGVANTRGLWLDDVAFASIRDVIITAFGDHGIYATDILSVAMDHVLVRGNKYGMYAANGDGSHPNAITMTACDFANTEYGIDLVNPANFCMFGGSVQGNGRTGSGASSDRFGIRMVGGAQQGAAACLLSGVYFELNVGDADILIDQTSDSNECIYTVVGCSFNRIDASDYVTNNIKVNAGSGKCHLHTNGNGFRGFNTYVEVTGRKYIAFTNTGADELVWHGALENMYESIDANPTINSISGPGSISPLFPMTHITTTGADAYTLPDGSEGQEIQIVMIVDGGAGTLTPTSLAGSATTITFDDGGDSAQLRFTNSSWYMVGGTATLA